MSKKKKTCRVYGIKTWRTNRVPEEKRDRRRWEWRRGCRVECMVDEIKKIRIQRKEKFRTLHCEKI